MKNKKVLKFGFIGATLTGVAVAFALVLNNSTGLLKVRGIDHDANCQWNHYDAVAATYAQHGSKEFWACCDHHSFSLSAPGEGHITDMGAFVGDYFDNLSSEDARYVPSLNQGNEYLSMSIRGWQDLALAYTKTQYTDVTSVTFKMRVTAAAEDLVETGTTNQIWANIGIGDNHSDWENGVDSFGLQTLADGEWHVISKYGFTKSGYVNFCYDMHHAIAGRIEIDDIRIEHAGGTAIETFENQNNLIVGFDNSQARIEGEMHYDNYMHVDFDVSYDDSALLYTFDQFTNVTKVEYKLRVNGLVTKRWQGVAVNSYANGVDQYANMASDDAFVADGEWHLRSHTISNKSGYVNFIKEVGNFDAESLDFDDVVIYHDGGLTLETFDDGACLLGVQRKYYFTTIKTDGLDIYKNVALDARTGGFETREYSATTFDLSRGVDAEYGPYMQLDNWQCGASAERCWLGFTGAGSLGKLEAELGQEPLVYYFYVYNPTNDNFQLQIQNNHHYTAIAYKTLVAKAWTRIDVELSTLDNPKTAEMIGFDHNYGSEKGALVGSGWKFTSIYAHGVVDYYARLSAGTYSSSKSPLYSIASYTGITSVSFDYRLTGGPTASGGWWGIGIGADHGLYTGMHTAYTPDLWDGQWRSKTISVSAEDGYVNIIHACGELVAESTIDIDNIVITYDGGNTVTENFRGGFNLFEVYSSHPEAVTLIEE